MNEGLSRWRFLAIWAIAFTIAVGYLIGNIPWHLLITP